MGYGLIFRCRHCNTKYRVSIGVGFMFPSIYDDVISKARKGYYGDRLKQEVNSVPYAAIDAEKYLYVCRCGWWKVDHGLSVYQPKDLENLLNEKFGEKTVRERVRVPYGTHYLLETNYQIKYRYYHYCEKCHKRMKNEPLFTNMKMCCKNCGAVLNEDIHNTTAYNWD